MSGSENSTPSFFTGVLTRVPRSMSTSSGARVTNDDKCMSNRELTFVVEALGEQLASQGKEIKEVREENLALRNELGAVASECDKNWTMIHKILDRQNVTSSAQQEHIAGLQKQLKSTVGGTTETRKHTTALQKCCEELTWEIRNFTKRLDKLFQRTQATEEVFESETSEVTDLHSKTPELPASSSHAHNIDDLTTLAEQRFSAADCRDLSYHQLRLKEATKQVLEAQAHIQTHGDSGDYGDLTKVERLEIKLHGLEVQFANIGFPVGYQNPTHAARLRHMMNETTITSQKIKDLTGAVEALTGEQDKIRDDTNSWLAAIKGALVSLASWDAHAQNAMEVNFLQHERLVASMDNLNRKQEYVDQCLTDIDGELLRLAERPAHDVYC